MEDVATDTERDVNTEKQEFIRHWRSLPLSTTHIRPFVEYCAGGSLFKTSKGGRLEGQKGGAKRGAIKGFSYGSRRRLMTTVAKVRLDAELPLFVTLTYPDTFPEPKESKEHLMMFEKRLLRAFEEAGAIWKLEPQERGAPHYHLMLWGVALETAQRLIPTIWYQVAGGGDPKHLAWHRGECGRGNVNCAQPVRSWRGVRSYASKYLGKTFEVAGWGKKWTGRYWGIIRRKNIPFGEMKKAHVEYAQAVKMMRYQRRFARLKRSGRSLTIFCDANQWADRLLEGAFFVSGKVAGVTDRDVVAASSSLSSEAE